MYMGRPQNIVTVNETYSLLAENYYRYLLRLGYSSHYTKTRYRYIKEFFHYLEQKGHTKIEQTTAKQISEYYSHISQRPSKNPERSQGGALSQKTTHGHMRNVKDLFVMLQTENRIKTNPCSTLKFPYPKEESEERTVLTQEEIKELYAATETAQERAILSMAYGCGLRVGELVKCNIEDIRLREKILIVPEGKGKKRRVVPMSSGTVKDLADYYYHEREELTKERDYKPKENAFMLHRRGGRMQKGTYNRNLKILIDRAGNETIQKKEITIHNLRHSIATHLIEQGITVEQVRMFLGHSQLETTQVYTHISKRLLNKLMQ
jgi:integrase/recombinase XerD